METRVSLRCFVSYCSSELCSNVCSTDFKFESQTYGIVTSEKLHISTSFNAKNISLMLILNNMGPRTDLCETP